MDNNTCVHIFIFISLLPDSSPIAPELRLYPSLTLSLLLSLKRDFSILHTEVNRASLSSLEFALSCPQLSQTSILSRASCCQNADSSIVPILKTHSCSFNARQRIGSVANSIRPVALESSEHIPIKSQIETSSPLQNRNYSSLCSKHYLNIYFM